jgi:hypothetical protein
MKQLQLLKCKQTLRENSEGVMLPTKILHILPVKLVATTKASKNQYPNRKLIALFRTAYVQ